MYSPIGQVQELELHPVCDEEPWEGRIDPQTHTLNEKFHVFIFYMYPFNKAEFTLYGME